MHKIQECKVVKPLVSMRKVVQAGNVVVLHEKNPHIRNNRDGTVIKLDVSDGRFLAGKVSEWLECHKQICKTEDEVQQ